MKYIVYLTLPGGQSVPSSWRRTKTRFQLLVHHVEVQLTPWRPLVVQHFPQTSSKPIHPLSARILLHDAPLLVHACQRYVVRNDQRATRNWIDEVWTVFFGSRTSNKYKYVFLAFLGIIHSNTSHFADWSRDTVQLDRLFSEHADHHFVQKIWSKKTQEIQNWWSAERTR